MSKVTEVPQPGDVFFYRSTDFHAKAIEKVQLNFASSKSYLIHAAIMISNQRLMEATTEFGVHYVNILENSETYSRYLPNVILRHPAFQGRENAYPLLLEKSYFYFLQGYDWLGAITHQFLSNRRSICSSLVGRILNDTDVVGNIFDQNSATQVYPSELHRMLLLAGFQEIDAYSQPNSLLFGLEDHHELSLSAMGAMAKMNDIRVEPHLTGLSAASVELLASKLNFEDPFLLLKQLFTIALSADCCPLDFLAEHLLGISRTVESLSRVNNLKPFHWRNTAKLKKSVLLTTESARRDIKARLLLFKGLCRVIAHFTESIVSSDENNLIDAEQATLAFFLLIVLSGDGEVGVFNEKSTNFLEVLASISVSKIRIVSPDLEREFLELTQFCVQNLGKTLRLIVKQGSLTPHLFNLSYRKALEDYLKLHNAVAAMIKA